MINFMPEDSVSTFAVLPDSLCCEVISWHDVDFDA